MSDAELAEALAEVARLRSELRIVGENLAHVQARCTELLEETRAQRTELIALRAALDGSPLPGWTCSACSAFNGSAKEQLLVCRCCGAARSA